MPKGSKNWGQNNFMQCMVCWVLVHVGLWSLRTIHWEVLFEQKKLAGASPGISELNSWILCFPVVMFREFTFLGVFLNEIKKLSIFLHVCPHAAGTSQELILCTGSTYNEVSSDLQQAHHNYSNFCLMPESSQEFSEDSPEKDQRFSVYRGLQIVLPVQVQY